MMKKTTTRVGVRSRIKKMLGLLVSYSLVGKTMNAEIVPDKGDIATGLMFRAGPVRRVHPLPLTTRTLSPFCLRKTNRISIGGFLLHCRMSRTGSSTWLKYWYGKTEGSAVPECGLLAYMPPLRCIFFFFFQSST